MESAWTEISAETWLVGGVLESWEEVKQGGGICMVGVSIGRDIGGGLVEVIGVDMGVGMGKGMD